ncbi:cellulose binding domain-containing protein [Catellatospora sp. KI3]|uniref:cellulose binding domain-containing protein n=1 Tax=Catellatospora sp. KI3 TaxID=3041620 RepID=UPI002482D96C|nr:cellulose binding domain-containing protein [Catellatospora sp. KI3]MDI1465383.1 cellulose binding domain-containing protein [Catellatospora sp. KI3]
MSRIRFARTPARLAGLPKSARAAAASAVAAVLVIAGVVAGSPPASAAAVAAFPGAAGPAMYATGGRGGDVYHVTNLTDNAGSPQPGSLRYGINTTPGSGRTIVFDVAGTIKLSPAGRQGWLTVNSSNLTIAGQTAPKPGITIMGQATKVTGKNIIIRHVKFRPGKDQANPGSATNDGIWITGDNVIVDHVSVSWADDEGISSSDGAGQVTVQYSIVSDGLNYGGHSYGAIIGSDVTGSNIAYHHNLFAHHKSRLPRLGNETGAVTNAEWSNNVIFEGKGYSGNDQLANGNFVGNTYLRQNTSNAEVFTGATGTAAYISGNRADYDGDSNLTNGVDIAWDRFTDVPTHKTSRFNVPNITTESAGAALTKVLDGAGAFWWARDAVDTRVVSETRSTSGSVVNEPNSTEWSNLWNAGQVNSPSGWDTDRDGMPNAWETAGGLNPNADDHNGDADGDGYRNIEEYLDYAAQGGKSLPTPPPASPSASSTPSPSPSTSPSASPTPSTPPPAGACGATYLTTNSWPGGFQGEVTVRAGSAPISGWTVRWTLGSGQAVTQLWSGRLTTSGTAVTVANESYNGALAASASTTFGFTATGTATTPALTCTSP